MLLWIDWMAAPAVGEVDLRAGRGGLLFRATDPGGVL